MSDEIARAESSPPAEVVLRKMFQEHELALLERAERSSNPLVRDYALNAAKRDRAHIQKQEARLSTKMALVTCLLVWMSGIAACWYSVVCQSSIIQARLIPLTLSVCVILTLLCLALSGHIKADILANFLQQFWDRWVKRRDDPVPTSLPALQAQNETSIENPPNVKT